VAGGLEARAGLGGVGDHCQLRLGGAGQPVLVVLVDPPVEAIAPSEEVHDDRDKAAAGRYRLMPDEPPPAYRESSNQSPPLGQNLQSLISSTRANAGIQFQMISVRRSITISIVGMLVILSLLIASGWFAIQVRVAPGKAFAIGGASFWLAWYPPGVSSIDVEPALQFISRNPDGDLFVDIIYSKSDYGDYTVTLWPTVMLPLVLPAVVIYLRRTRRGKNRCCNCNYELSGLPDGMAHCPECGSNPRLL
jgi:hypothetical protein